MTLSHPTATKFRYEGNGVTDTFAYDADTFSTADLVVQIVTRTTSAVEETLTLTTDYTVTIADDRQSSVQVVAGKIPDATQDIVIDRDLTKTQSLNLPTGTQFPAGSVEDALDRTMAVIQDQQEELDRSFKVLAAEIGGTADLTVPSISERGGKYLAFDASGNAIAADGTGTNPVSTAMAPVVSASTLAAGRTAFGLDSMALEDAADYYDTTETYTKTEIDNARNTAIQTSLNIHGGCLLQYSAVDELIFNPYNGNKIIINGSFESVPTAGITIDNTGLSASTLYYVYVYMSAGTMTLELSATTYTSHTDGVQIKTGDSTRTLVGMIYTDGSSQFTNNNGDIANWFNRKPVAITGSFTTTRTTTATSFTEIDSEIRTNFLSWGDAAQISFGDSITHNTTSAIGTTAIYLLTTNIISTSHLFVSGASNVNTSLSCAYEPSVGRSYATIFGKTTSGTLSYLSGATEVGHGRLTVLVNI